MTPPPPPPVTDGQLFNLFTRIRNVAEDSADNMSGAYMAYLARTGLVLLERRARALHTPAASTPTVPAEVEEAEKAVSK